MARASIIDFTQSQLSFKNYILRAIYLVLFFSIINYDWQFQVTWLEVLSIHLQTYMNTFMKPHWFESVRNEYRACRESVAIADYSSFTKLDLTSSGSEVVDFLQYVCSNDVDVPIGAILHTGMHNENGNCFLINFGHLNIKSKKN